MANLQVLTPQARRDLLTQLLIMRGYTPESARNHTASLRTDAEVYDDLTFHKREDDGVKAGGPLPLREIYDHYTGPLHTADGNAIDAALSRAGASRDVLGPQSSSPPQGTPLTMRDVAGGVALLLALSLAAYGAVRIVQDRATKRKELSHA